MGPYCQFCERRCFVYLTQEMIVTDYHRGCYHLHPVDIIATCHQGQAYERKTIGCCYDDLMKARYAFHFVEMYQGPDFLADGKPYNGPVYRGMASDGRVVIVTEDVYHMNQPGNETPDDFIQSADSASVWIEPQEATPFAS